MQLTITEAAKRVKCSRFTVWRWVKKGRLRGTNRGGIYFVDANELSRMARPEVGRPRNGKRRSGAKAGK